MEGELLKAPHRVAMLGNERWERTRLNRQPPTPPVEYASAYSQSTFLTRFTY